MINAKSALRKILKEWGHDILLQRRLSDDFKYSDILERVTTRSQFPRNSKIALSLNENTEGYFADSDLLYFFEASVDPKSGDRIYEESAIDYESTVIYKIDDAYPVRGRFGEVTYWLVGASKENPA